MRDLEDRRTPLSPQLAVRVALFGGIALAVFAVIFFRLWFLQVLSGDQYLVQARENRTRDVRIQAPRGEIVDRNNRELVTNRPSNVVQIEPQGLPDQTIDDAAEWGQAMGERERRLELLQARAEREAERRNRNRKKGQKRVKAKKVSLATVPLPTVATPDLAARYRRLGRLLEMRPETIHRRVIEQLVQLPYSAVTIRSDAPNSVVSYIKERQELFPGVDVERQFLRSYPRKNLAAQLVGYVGEINPDQLKKRRNKGVEQGTIIGQAGLEYTYDRYLRGKDGAKILRVDASGKFVGEALQQRDPTPGRQVRLSLDLGLQEAGQKAIAEIGGGLPGGFVAMNPRNGQVYAMGSYPSFDPSVFAKPVSNATYAKLTSEENGAPLINRAIAGTYPSGSVFKPITQLAALDEGVVGIDEPIADTGCMDIGTREACNAKKTVYGPVALRKALAVSSDIYYYKLGIELFHQDGEPLQKWAKKMGFGRSTGIDLPDENEGTIPGPTWRRKINKAEMKCRKKQNGVPCFFVGDARDFNVGDSANLAVGQGEVAISPLQMAVSYSGLATGGRIPRPHLGLEIQDASGRLVQKVDPGPARRVKIDKAWQQAIMDGLHQATVGDGGTSAGVFAGWPQDRLPVFGKTGTAETFVNGAPYDQSWYVAYVPHKTKPIVIATTVERGGFGAEKAAPIVRRMLAHWFDLGADQAKPEATAAELQAAAD
ncbi:MAG TPA: penicillin-binding transpeptidase domain-containing protein [Solirubrobacteraceae bacterium]|nr:penicillin-binding transpeptidase domain-containing protein [Solirubrobacteraceae bacterium]